MYVRTKAGRAQATRAALEAVGRELFGARGFENVAAEELVAAAGVTRGALYHHYDGKEGLFAAVVEEAIRALHRELVEAAAGAADPMSAIQAGVQAFLVHCTEPSAQRLLLVDAPAVLGWQRW